MGHRSCDEEMMSVFKKHESKRNSKPASVTEFTGRLKHATERMSKKILRQPSRTENPMVTSNQDLERQKLLQFDVENKKVEENQSGYSERIEPKSFQSKST